MPLRYVTLDVFTDTAFAGNPLAVVFTPETLEDAVMQAVAAEFNLSETVFVTEPQGREADYGLRIYTPKEELPFAGHPTVGAAVALALDKGGEPGKARRFVLEETVGDVTCDARVNGEDTGSARFFVPRLPERIGDLPDVSLLARALGLEPGDLMNAPLNDGVWSAGVPFAIIPLRFSATMTRIAPNISAFDEAFGGDEPMPAYVVAKASETEFTTDWRVRMFGPHLGIMEDPATGGAAAAFAGLLAEECGFGDGEHAVSIYQGVEMGRPSLLRLLLKIEAGRLTDVMIGGDAVKISEGTLLHLGD